MAAYFSDTSAVVKRYVTETGTVWMKALGDPAAGNTIYVARITGVELVSAIARRQKGGTVAPADAVVMLAQLRLEFQSRFRVVDVTSALIAQAMDLAEKHALRGFDAVQLAAALEARVDCQLMGLPLTLLSADAELNAAAVAEGLTVDDPNQHP